MNTNMKTEKKSFITKMPADLHHKLRIMAIYNKIDMQDVVNYAVRKEIELFEQQVPAIKALYNFDSTKNKYNCSEESSDEKPVMLDNNNIQI